MRLNFPADRVVGSLTWSVARSGLRGQAVATGAVSVPDGAEIRLRVAAPDLEDSGRGALRTATAVDLAFLAALPATGIGSLTLGRVLPASLPALQHVSEGLHHLYLAHSGLSDDALPEIAALTGLRYLQTFGNHFTDAGVQQLVALQHLDALYLEEPALSVAAFAFVTELPRLERLGIQDVPLSVEELRQLRQRLPGVLVG